MFIGRRKVSHIPGKMKGAGSRLIVAQAPDILHLSAYTNLHK